MLWGCADDSLLLDTILEEDQGRDAHHVVLCRRHRVVVDIQLADRDVGVSRRPSPSRTGAMTRHGPHHSAQKSTRIGLSALMASLKVPSLRVTMFSAILVCSLSSLR